MTDEPRSCKICGAEIPKGALACPMCSTPVDWGPQKGGEGPGPVPSAPAAVPSYAGGSPKEGADPTAPLRGAGPRRDASSSAKVRGPSPMLTQRMQKLASWQEKSRGLNVIVPTLPNWADGSATTAAEEERWEEGVLGLERTAYKEISGALDTWMREAGGRLNRLEAYGLPSPTERRSLEELGRSLKAADLDRALDLYQKTVAVVVMKERNLDEAIDSVEAVKVLSTDIEVVGLTLPWKDPGAGSRLENELRAGKVSEAYREAKDMRASARDLLSQRLPSKVNAAAELVANEKKQGQEVQQQAALLAKAARALRQGRAEEALREMVRFQSQRTLDPFAQVERELQGKGS